MWKDEHNIWFFISQNESRWCSLKIKLTFQKTGWLSTTVSTSKKDCWYSISSIQVKFAKPAKARMSNCTQIKNISVLPCENWRIAFSIFLIISRERILSEIWKVMWKDEHNIWFFISQNESRWCSLKIKLTFLCLLKFSENRAFLLKNRFRLKRRFQGTKWFFPIFVQGFIQSNKLQQISWLRLKIYFKKSRTFKPTCRVI